MEYDWRPRFVRHHQPYYVGEAIEWDTTGNYTYEFGFVDQLEDNKSLWISPGDGDGGEAILIQQANIRRQFDISPSQYLS
jgi:hypothetical protein